MPWIQSWTIRLAWVLLTATMVTGCGRNAGSPPAADGTADGGRPDKATFERQREVALAAQKDLFERLSGRLMAVLSEGGPVEAIAVCSQEASEITQAVGQEHQVKIGRTSFRLRNDRNVPPAWATKLVEQRLEVPQFVSLADGQLGALLPIRLKPTCLLCHGANEQIPEAVQQALADNYPRDQATGFQLDALRGWFWVEVPPPMPGGP